MFDTAGRLSSISDPDSGEATIHYNGFGEVVRRTDGNLDEERTVVDRLGRPTSRTNKDGQAVWTWDTAPGGIGRLASATTFPGDATFTASSQSYAYDSTGRTNAVTYSIGAHTYGMQSTFDVFGRLDTLQYPAVAAQPLRLRYTYNANNGQLLNVFDANAAAGPAGLPADASRVFWTATGRDLEGRLLANRLGNGVAESRTFDTLGRLLTIQAGLGTGSAVESLSYLYSDVDNTRTRDDLVLGSHETFEYDSMNRLHFWNYTGAPGVGIWRIRYPYDATGNLKGRAVDAGVGSSLTFNYNEPGPGGGPHALTSTDLGSYGYDATGQQTSAPGRPVVAYNMNGLPSLIQRNDGRQVRYSFDCDGRRVRQADSVDGTTTYVAGYYEHKEGGGASQETFNVFADGRKVAEMVGTGGASSSVHYLHEDGLGSVVTVTDQNGAMAEPQHRTYDPFGRRFDYQTSPLVDFGSTSSIR